MLVEVKAALLGLIPDPGWFTRRQRQILGQHWTQPADCNLENM
jgi:hypothetical protein